MARHLDQPSQQLGPQMLVVQRRLRQSRHTVGQSGSDGRVGLCGESSEEMRADVGEGVVGEGVDQRGRGQVQRVGRGDGRVGRRFQRQSSEKEQGECSELMDDQKDINCQSRILRE